MTEKAFYLGDEVERKPAENDVGEKLKNREETVDDPVSEPF